MAVFKREGSPFFQVEFEFKGRRIRESTGTTKRKAAEAYERKLRDALYDEVVLGKVVIEPMTIRQAVDRYIQTHLKHKKRRKKTATNDVYLLDNLIVLLGGDDVQISSLTTKVISDWRDTLIDGRKPATANRYLAMLKAILRRAHRKWHTLAVMPVIELFPSSNMRVRWLTLKDEAKLLKACERQPHLYNLVVFLLDTGARCGEATDLEWQNVHLDGDGGFVTFLETKWGKHRSVDLTERLNVLLTKLKQTCPDGERRVFLRRTPGCSWRGTKPTAKPVTSWWRAWQTAVERAGLEDVCRHDLRHTFASRLVQDEVSLQVVSQLLGHSSLTMTQRYAHLAKANFKSAIARLNAIKRT